MRDKQQAESEIKTGLQLIEELNHEGTRKAAQKVMRTLPDLFHYFDIAEGIVKESKTLVDDETLKAYCLAWQWGKAVRKAKKSGRKQSANGKNKPAWNMQNGGGNTGLVRQTGIQTFKR